MSLGTTAIRIKVTLKDVTPEVMRYLVVPLALRLDRLHLTLQAAFGWTDSHLFEFRAGDMSWGIPDPDDGFGDPPIDARKSRLYDIVRETGAKTIHYLYDFGDGWDHEIKLEKWFENTPMDMLTILRQSATPPIPNTRACCAGGPKRLTQKASIKRRTRPPSRRSPKNGNPARGNRDVKGRQAPIETVPALRLRSIRRRRARRSSKQ
jgi:hypothetical protein